MLGCRKCDDEKGELMSERMSVGGQKDDVDRDGRRGKGCAEFLFSIGMQCESQAHFGLPIGDSDLLPSA